MKGCKVGRAFVRFQEEIYSVRDERVISPVKHALEWVVPCLPSLIIDNVVTTVGLVDVDLALGNCGQLPLDGHDRSD